MRIELSSQIGSDGDERQITEDLARLPDLESIKILTVQPSSMVTNLRFLSAVPALEELRLYGLRLRSLDGLEWFRSGRVIQVDTGKNRTRTTEKISTTRIDVLVMAWANAGDLATIGRTTTLRKLDLSRCPPLSFKQWRETPLETIQLFGGSIEELSDTGELSKLQVLTLAVHRKLKGFTGDNGNVVQLTVQECNLLDFSTLATFTNLTDLTIVDIKRELPLSAFGGLGHLRKLSLMGCNVVLDRLSLKSSAPFLSDLHILNIPTERLVELSSQNPDLIVSNGDWTCRNGTLEAI